MYSTNGLRDSRELLEISQQREIPLTERFRTKNAFDVWKRVRVWEYTFSTMKQIQFETEI